MLATATASLSWQARAQVLQALACDPAKIASQVLTLSGVIELVGLCEVCQQNQLQTCHNHILAVAHHA